MSIINNFSLVEYLRIGRRSHTLNSTQDFDFAMWSTYIIAPAMEEAQGP